MLRLKAGVLLITVLAAVLVSSGCFSEDTLPGKDENVELQTED